MSEAPVVDQWIWTDADFERMGWHDAQIHALAWCQESGELLLDLDYILEWAGPCDPDEAFRFWTVPATLVFDFVTELRIDLRPWPSFDVLDLHRSAEPVEHGRLGSSQERTWRWTIVCHEGEIVLHSPRFTQYIRRAPVLNTTQSLSLGERGGLSFARERQDAPAA